MVPIHFTNSAPEGAFLLSIFWRSYLFQRLSEGEIRHFLLQQRGEDAHVGSPDMFGRGRGALEWEGAQQQPENRNNVYTSSSIKRTLL